MTIPALPSDTSAGSTWTAAEVNAIYDLLALFRDGRPIFKGGAIAAGPTTNVLTSTATTFGFGVASAFSFTPVINVGGWTTKAADSDPESLVVPEAGIYQVTINVGWVANATGARQARVVVDGSVDNTIYSVTTPGQASFNGGNNLSGLLDLAANAELDISVWQNSGSTLAADCYLSAVWMQST